MEEARERAAIFFENNRFLQSGNDAATVTDRDEPGGEVIEKAIPILTFGVNCGTVAHICR